VRHSLASRSLCRHDRPARQAYDPARATLALRRREGTEEVLAHRVEEAEVPRQQVVAALPTTMFGPPLPTKTPLIAP